MGLGGAPPAAGSAEQSGRERGPGPHAAMPQAPRGDLERGQGCSASPSSSRKGSERGNGFFLSLLFFSWRCCLKSHCRGWGPGCVPCACRVGGCCGCSLVLHRTQLSPSPCLPSPATPLPLSFALGCSLPHSHLAAVLRSPLLHPVAHRGGKSLGAARAGCTFPAPAMGAAESRSGAWGCRWVPCPALPLAPSCLPPAFASSVAVLPVEAGCKAGTRGKTDRQTDRWPPATHLSASGDAPAPPALALLRAAPSPCPD